jgi:hypothetical protein
MHETRGLGNVGAGNKDPAVRDVGRVNVLEAVKEPDDVKCGQPSPF